MSWLDNLKSLLHFEINSPLFVNNVVINSNNTNSLNKVENKEKKSKQIKEGITQKPLYYIDEEKKELNLLTDNMSDDEQEKLKPLIQEYLNTDNPLLEKKASTLLENLYVYNKEKKNLGIIQFFKPIISISDLEILEGSLYIREIFMKGENIINLKKDLITRFGDRGNNFANLCTAGYFDNFLMPLYNSSPEQFTQLYEGIVGRSMLTVFVHSGMDEKQIIDNITSKLKISKQYGVNFIHIHGIGKFNITTIKKCLTEKSEFFDGFYVKIKYDKDYIIIVELLKK